MYPLSHEVTPPGKQVFSCSQLSFVYEIEPAVWGRVGHDPRLQPMFQPVFVLDCLLLYPHVGAGIRLECRITVNSDIINTSSQCTAFPKRLTLYLLLASLLQRTVDSL